MSTATTDQPKRAYKYYDLVMAAFVTILICSNLIGPAKAAQVTLPLIGPITFGAGVLFFPISYIFGDVLTEVYGYARARKVIWTGFAALIFAALMSAVIVALPPAPDWPNQHIYEVAFGNTWRIAIASMTAYFCGEAVDSSIFYPLAFLHSGIMPDELVMKLTLVQFVTKTAVEIVFLPVTY